MIDRNLPQRHKGSTPEQVFEKNTDLHQGNPEGLLPHEKVKDLSKRTIQIRTLPRHKVDGVYRAKSGELLGLPLYQNRSSASVNDNYHE